MTTLLAMEITPLKHGSVDSDDGLSPRLSGMVQSLGHQRCEPAFLPASSEEVYEDSPRPAEVSSATANIVSSIYGEYEIEMKASDITRAVEAMALREGSETIALYGAKFATFEELLDPENVDPTVTREECYVALQRWHASCDAHVVRGSDGREVFHPPAPPRSDGDDEDSKVIANCTLSPCCRRVPNEEVDELRYHNKLLQKSIDDLQFQLTTNEKKLNHLKDEKLKLTQEARELRTTMDMYYGYKGDNEILEKDNTRLAEVVLSLKEDLTKAKKQRDDFKRKTDELMDSNYELTLKVEQCVQNEALFNGITTRKLVQFNALQSRLDATLAELRDRERDVGELTSALKQHEERLAELGRAKERRRRSAESDCSETPVFPLACFDEDAQDVPTVPSSPAGGISLFAELRRASKVALFDHRDASTSCELVYQNSTSQTFTPVMEDHATQTVDNMEPHLVSHTTTPDREHNRTPTPQSIEYVETPIRNSTPDIVDQETQTVESVTTNLLSRNPTPDMVDEEIQTVESTENIETYLPTHDSTPDMVDQETQTVERMVTCLVTRNPTTDMVDQEIQTVESTEKIETYPDMVDRETQTVESVERVLRRNSTPYMEDGATQTVEIIDTYLVNGNWAPFAEDRGTQTVGGYVMGVYPALATGTRVACARTALATGARDPRTRTTYTVASALAVNETLREAAPETRFSSRTTQCVHARVTPTPYIGVAPVKRDRMQDPWEEADGERRGFYAFSSDAESDAKQRYSFAEEPSFRVNREEKATVLVNTDVDGSGDAARDTKYALKPTPPPTPRPNRRAARSDQLRRNEARVTLDRELALLGIEVEGVSRPALRQLAVVNRALEHALDEAEGYGCALQAIRCANAVAGRKRTAATMTVMFPLRRCVSEPVVGLFSGSRGPLTRRDGPGGCRPRPNRPPKAVSVATPACQHHHSRWRLATCVLFVLLSAMLFLSCQGYDCHGSRARGSPLQALLDQLERYGYVKRNTGPRPI